MATLNLATAQRYEFTLIYERPTGLTRDLGDAIFEDDRGDATLGMVGAGLVLDFCRQPVSFEEKLTPAIGDVR